MPNHRSLATCLAQWRLVALAAGIVFTLAPASARAQGTSSLPPWLAPERASHRTNAVPTSAEAVKHGQRLFLRDCAKCHGNTGHGDGKDGLTLSPRPADFTSERVQAQTDGALYWKMTEGRGLMPRATLGDQEKWSVIDYLRTLASPKHARTP